ncbi:MAG: lysylphosphatidylglycerol synthase transmembrane domain-containing protein [Bacteroidales bacterium]|nr:lysylphosphatidylglycerol synthase transmembrane domain-containing protein [Bacteroidales bacterium]MEE1226786.1 lysylphosphatidylglycerol synthase transmembrane domain-containing protein [Bacteroidales bacterium]
MKSKLRNILQTLFFTALGFAFIWWFWTKLETGEKTQIWDSLKQTNYLWFILAIAISLLSHYVRALRWRLMSETFSCKVSRTNSFLAVMSGYLTNLAVPRLGEVVRCTMLKQSDNIPIEKSLGTIVTERIIDMILFALLLLTTIVIQKDLLFNYIEKNFNLNIDNLFQLFIIGVVVLAIVMGLFFAFKRKIQHNKTYNKTKDLIKGFLEGIKSIFKLKNPWLFIFYSILIWALWIFGTFICFQCLNQTDILNPIQALVTTVLGAFGPMITPGGIGLQPAIFAQVLETYTIAKPIGYVCGWLNWLSSQVGTIVVGLIAFIYFSTKKKRQL